MDGAPSHECRMGPTAGSYNSGTLVWLPHPKLVWIGGQLLEDFKPDQRSLKIRLEDHDQTIIQIDIKNEKDLPPLRNPEILTGVNDLTMLSYLHEPAVLNNLQYRFVTQKHVYTYCGIVLVAINPYADCSHLYNDNAMQVYHGVGKQVRDHDPHIFGVAEEAFYDLCEYQKNQSIIVSGESGAGKTVSAKHSSSESADRYHYTNGGGKTTIDGVDDRMEFAETAHHNSLIEQLCDDLLLVDAKELTRWLTQREIRTANETVIKPLTKAEAVRGRDAFAKMMYSNLFNWIVLKINYSLASKEQPWKRQQEKFIGVLDIYGFETFDVNSFEQFCINYANEKLQQQFNQQVFKLEQEEYEREDLSWVRMEFYDNQPCIEMIEGRPGLIEYLDEQCKLLKGSDSGWLDQLTNCPKLKQHGHLQMPKIKAPAFTIRHFAADVLYGSEGFLEKNKDSVGRQIIEVMASTKNPFLLEVISPCLEEIIGAQPRGKVGTAKRTVANQFRDSLRELMAVLQATRPHYVRCIKPNDGKESFYFEPQRAIQQLRACGVLETVRISATGYPSRWIYGDFVTRYRLLAWSKNVDDVRLFTKNLCTELLETDKFALGRTKIFFRTGQVALLERLRHETLGRKYYAEKKYQKLRTTILAIQSLYRASQVRVEYQRMRYEKSAITIQRYFRGYLVRRDHISYVRKVIKVQSCVRRWLAKRRWREAKLEARSVGHLQKLNMGLENKIIELQIKLDSAMTNNAKIHTLEEEKRALERKLKEERVAAQLAETVNAEQIRDLRQSIDEINAELATLQSERPGFLRAHARMLKLEEEIDALHTQLEMQARQLMEAEGRRTAAEDELEMAATHFKHASITYQAQIAEARTGAEAASAELEEVNRKMREEAIRRENAEKDLDAMREQLLANTSLLADGAITINGSEGHGALGFMADEHLPIVLRQQGAIRQLHNRCAALQRDKERLRSVVHSEALLGEFENRPSVKAGEDLKLQDYQAMNRKLHDEIDRLVAAQFPNDIKAKDMIDRLFQDTERLRQENYEYRALLCNNSKMRSSPRPDSGHCSAAQSDAGSECDRPAYDPAAEMDVDRQLRACKRQIEMLERTRMDQDLENERLVRLLDVEMRDVCFGRLKPLDCSVEAMRLQIGDLIMQNLELTQKYHRQADELAGVKAQLHSDPEDLRGNDNVQSQVRAGKAIPNKWTDTPDPRRGLAEASARDTPPQLDFSALPSASEDEATPTPKTFTRSPFIQGFVQLFTHTCRAYFSPTSTTFNR
ncbi:unnamed protein product, partial [Mesorhabditis spiculigera]